MKNKEKMLKLIKNGTVTLDLIVEIRKIMRYLATNTEDGWTIDDVNEWAKLMAYECDEAEDIVLALMEQGH